MLVHLDRPDQSGKADEAITHKVLTLIQSIQDECIRIITATQSNRSLAKTWLYNAIASIPDPSPAIKRRRFAQFLPGGSRFSGAASQVHFGHQVLQQVIDDQPQQIGALLAHDPSFFKTFFTADHPDRSKAWFGHFSMNGIAEFKHGALALARYALANRQSVWELLVWGGKHAQAPVAVASKPHYFCELDVVQTVAALQKERGFWECEEFVDSIHSGEVVKLDPGYFATALYTWLNERSSRSNQLFEIICDYLEQTPWQRLCQRLCPHLSDIDLALVANRLLEERRSNTGAVQKEERQNNPALDAVFSDVEWSLDQLLYVAACAFHLTQLLRLLQDSGEALQVIRGFIQQLNEVETSVVYWQVRDQLADQPLPLRQLWATHLLAVRCWLHGLKKAEIADFLTQNGLPCSVIELEGRDKKKKKKKKHRHERKRRWREDSDDEEEDEARDEWLEELRTVQFCVEGRDGNKKTLSYLELLDFINVIMASTWDMA